jgi:glycosyltransferase involved in cell wall biosynthesis
MLGGIGRRVQASRRVWRRGDAHLALVSDEPVVAAAVEFPLPWGGIDDPVPGSVLPRGPVAIGGWALFESGPPVRVDLSLGGVDLGPARLGGYRPDVEQAYGFDGTIAHFEHVVDVEELGLEGEVTLRALATGPAGERLELPPAVAFVAPAIERPRRPPPPPASGGDGLRLLVHTHRLNLGGAQLILQDTLLAMQRHGALRCDVVSPYDGDLRAPLEAAGMRVHVTGPVPIDDPEVYAARVEELAAWTARGGYDAAFVNTGLSFAGADAARLAGVPLLWAIRESYTPSMLWRVAFGAMDPEVRDRANAALAAADTAIFEAEATRLQYVDHIDGACLTRPYGLDLGALEAERAVLDVTTARAALGMPPDAKVVIAVGTAEPRKAQVPLVQAFGLIAERHPDAILVVIGAGDPLVRGADDGYSDGLRAYAAGCAWAEQVRILPVTPETTPWYATADLMVCASDLESLPRSVLESMWWETPVVATAIFGLPELIDHGRTGWLCEPRDVRALAGALDLALSTPEEERRAIARAARAHVCEHHDMDRYALECLDLLRGIGFR